MKYRQRVEFLCLVFAAGILAMMPALSWAERPQPPDQSSAVDPAAKVGQSHCVVATVNPRATDAALQAFRDGGCAVDAAVAAALTLGVVDTHNSGLGGGCFILIRHPDGTLTAIDGRETAPAAASAEMYVRDSQVVAQLSRTGPLAVAVPGALAAYDLAIGKAGKKSLADLLGPAADLAQQGFPLDPLSARVLASKASELAEFPGSRDLFFKPDGRPLAAGDMLHQPDLAKVYRNVARRGIDWFYRGPLADQVGRWMADHGGILTAADFAAYRPRERNPIVTRYRDYQVIGFPPPSSGGIHVAQMLNILSSFDLAAEHQRDAGQACHLIVETMKLAFADRAHWLGDADFAQVPLGLVSKPYAQLLRRRINPYRSTTVPSHGQPLTVEEGYFGRHTTHIAAADSDGYWVAITATINTHYGSKVIVPGTGVMLNNEMDDFSSQPGVPNAFGLIGAENNAIAPGKRPLSSMSPTIILDSSGSPVMTVGAAGGPKIITQVLLAIIRHLDYGQSLDQAVAEPRFHHQWKPDSVLVEEHMDQQLVESLKRRGHAVETTSSAGVTQAISRRGGQLHGVHDPRIPGKVGRVSVNRTK